MTAGGRLKLAVRILLMALISAGVGSVGARRSLKKLDSGKIFMLETEESSEMVLSFEVSAVDFGCRRRREW
jgi:hypothetical protein